MNIIQSFGLDLKRSWDREKDVTLVHGLLVKGPQNWDEEDTALYQSFPEDVVKEAESEFDRIELESAYHLDTLNV